MELKLQQSPVSRGPGGAGPGAGVRGEGDGHSQLTHGLPVRCCGLTVRTQWDMRQIEERCPWDSESVSLRKALQWEKFLQDKSWQTLSVNYVFSTLWALPAPKQLLNSAIEATKQQRWSKPTGLAVSTKLDEGRIWPHTWPEHSRVLRPALSRTERILASLGREDQFSDRNIT